MLRNIELFILITLNHRIHINYTVAPRRVISPVPDLPYQQVELFDEIGSALGSCSTANRKKDN